MLCLAWVEFAALVEDPNGRFQVGYQTTGIVSSTNNPLSAVMRQEDAAGQGVYMDEADIPQGRFVSVRHQNLTVVRAASDSGTRHVPL